MKTLLILLALSGPLGFQQALLMLSGASCAEELSEDEIERYRSLAARPVDLNRAGRSRLLSTGLLTPFQVASLLDWRQRSGDILSWTELGLVDGFTPELVPALQEFFVLGTRDEAPGKRDDGRFRQTLTLKGGARLDGSLSWGAKYGASLGERAVLNASARGSYDAPFRPVLSGSAAYFGRDGQIIVGAFNARFGQGLVQWSGFQLNGYNSPGAFRKNGTGLSPSASYSPELMGVAADWHFGRWRLSAAYSWQGQQVLANLTRTGRMLTAGLTVTGQAASLEFRTSLPDWSLFGELAGDWQGRLTGISGAVWTPVFGHSLGLVGRWLGTGRQYSGVAAGYEGPQCSATLDASWRPDTGAARHKALVQWKNEYALAGVQWQPLLRAAATWRPAETMPLRLEARAVLTAVLGRWSLGGRYDAVYGRGFAWNWYAEGGFRAEKLTFYLRGGLFKVDDWDDRIYVYERDAPGSFTVPARYGRGWNASAYAAWQISWHHSLWLRLETVQYPWNPAPKAGRTELRMQYRYRL